jgi:hypothetical protein
VRKNFELAEKKSCLNQAGPNEMLFVLRSHDVCAPATIRDWCQHRILRGKNKLEDKEIQDALAAANIMERER